MNSSQNDRLPRDPVELLKLVHRTPRRFLDDDLAPEVDLDLLWQLVRKELSRKEARLVYMLIDAFRSWDEAHTKVIVEHFHQVYHPQAPH
jgi:hypothetical protein